MATRVPSWPAVGEDGSPRILLLAAGLVFIVDLAVKAVAVGAKGAFFHPRSTLAGAAVCVAMGLLGVAILRVRCRALSLTGGILIGAGAGNFVSAFLWRGVPDYLAIGGTVFNLADAAALVGGVGLVLVALALLLNLSASTSRGGRRATLS